MAGTNWGRKYKKYNIFADYRIHQKVITIINEYLQGKEADILDIACGEGSLSQRVIDNNPSVKIDVNDLEPEKIKFLPSLFIPYDQHFSVSFFRLSNQVFTAGVNY